MSVFVVIEEECWINVIERSRFAFPSTYNGTNFLFHYKVKIVSRVGHTAIIIKVRALTPFLTSSDTNRGRPIEYDRIN